MNTGTETNKKTSPRKRIRLGSRPFDQANRKCVYYPEIRLGGRWLHENGFYIGQYVRVIVEEDRLILIREPEPGPAKNIKHRKKKATGNLNV